MRYTAAPDRRQEVVDRLAASGYVSSATLAGELGVSEMTIRRDLRQLEHEGVVRRVPGGAALPVGGGQAFDERSEREVDTKAAIARAAAAALGDAVTVALDAGTTIVHVAPLLSPTVTVVTHSIPVMAACADRGDLGLLGLGGTYQSATRSFAGPATRTVAEQLDLDVALLSAVAVGPDGLYCANPLDAETKQLLALAARRVVVLVDHTKFDARAPLRFMTWAQIDAVVTDERASAETLTWLRASVGEVIIAGTSTRTAGQVI